MIPVTKPFLPPQEEYQTYLNGIWQRQWLTNNGPLVNELELQLKTYLKVPHLLFLTNGTVAIQIAIKALNLTGEIITTPFSYVATTSSIVWENCSPIFVDIDPLTLNIDPKKIEAAITNKTTGILATHVYGNPCDIEAIEKIAKKHQLKVIYDAAHCFGTKYKGESVFAYGDVSTTSFHATKLFHTNEGGAVFTPQPDILKTLAYMRNFGHNGPEAFHGVGINGKNSEFHAAMGLTNLPYISSILDKRKSDSLYYDLKLKSSKLIRPTIQDHTDYNYSYYPILFPNEDLLLMVYKSLEIKNIYCRRYFYPSLSDLPYVDKQPTPISDDISKRVLCLPLFYTLTKEEIDMITRYILRVLNNE